MIADPSAATEGGAVDRFGRQRLVERSDGKACLGSSGTSTVSAATGGMESVDDGVEHSGAPVAPPGPMQRDGKLSVSVLVHRSDAGDQSGHRRAIINPAPRRVVDGVADPVSAVTEQRHEQVIAASEMVCDACVGHVDPLSNGSDLDSVGTALDEQLLGCLEDLELGRLRAAADTFF